MAQDLENVTLKLQWFDQFQFAGYYIAKEKGFYKDVGLDVNIKNFNTGDSPAKEVLSGRAEYGTGRTSLIIDKSEGKNIFLLASIFQSSPMVLITKKSSGLDKIEDFAGKKIMLTGTETSAGIFAMTNSKGVHASDMQTIQGKNKVENILNGKTDIISAYEANQGHTLKEQNIDINIFNPKDYGFDFYGDILFTNENEINNHRERVIKFKKASLKGWEYAFAHIDETIEIIQAKYNSQNKTKEALRYEANKLKKLAYYKTKKIGKITQKKVEEIYNIYRVMGFIKKPIKFDDFIFKAGNRELYLTQKEKDWLSKHPVLTYSEVNWEPLSVIENNKMGGILGGFLDKISKYTGIKFQFIPSKSWTNVIEKFKNKEIDFIPSNPQIFDLGLFSDTYKTFPMVIVTNDKYKYINNLDIFNNKTIAVPEFYTSYNYIITNYPDIKIKTTKDIAQALTLVQEGKADAFVGHMTTSLYNISNLYLTDLKISGTTGFEYKHSYLIQKDMPEFLSIVNKAFKLITKEEVAEIYSHWTNTKIENKVDYSLIWKIILIASLLFLLLQYRNYKLAKHNKEIHKLKERLELALAGSNDGVWDRNFIENTLYISPRWKEMIGYKDSELPNEPNVWNTRVHADDLRQAQRDIENHINGKTNSYVNTHRLKHKDGHWVWILDRGQRILDKNGKVVRMLGTHTDITKQKELEISLEKQKNKLHYQANYDSLTGLPNRALFHDRLNHNIEKSIRDQSKFALLFLDLDMFKQINDSFGHEFGDMVLKEVGNRIKKILRKGDTLARLGGDEFTIITEHLSKAENIRVLAEKILDLFKEPIIINQHNLYISTSIGISLFPDDSKSAKNLLKYADSAMYKAKDEGRNNYKFYSKELTELVFQRIVLENSLRIAIQNEELVIYYQPQIDAKTEKLTGMEALVRWQHPTLGLISPAKFIPIAEETRLIVDIDRWMMKKAMHQFGQWYKNGLNPGTLALNLSMKQLKSDDFLQVVTEDMNTCNFKAEWLEFEVTESKVMEKPKEMILKLNKLNSMGIKIAIDDFGTGYSSLSYLKKLPINTLKIDQSFISGVPQDNEDVAIVKAIIAIAKSLNLDLVGEGVETLEQKEFLLTNGCQNIQGYFYSKPIPSYEVKNLFLK